MLRGVVVKIKMEIVKYRIDVLSKSIAELNTKEAMLGQRSNQLFYEQQDTLSFNHPDCREQVENNIGQIVVLKRKKRKLSDEKEKLEALIE